jgi:signal transduction histidine kinase
MTNMDLLEMAAQELTLVKFPIQQIIVEAYKFVVGALKAKNHEASFDLPKPPIHIYTDKEKLERAIVNVLNNAVRFTPTGGQISVSLSEDTEHAHLSIHDNGIGIPPDELEKIFDRFYQVDSHLTRTEGGMGLGLSIARGLIQAHGGKMWAESEGKDKGTTIQIILPKA